MHHYELTVAPTFQVQGLDWNCSEHIRNLDDWLSGTVQVTQNTRRETKSKKSRMQTEHILRSTQLYEYHTFAGNCNHEEEIQNSDFGGPRNQETRL